MGPARQFLIAWQDSSGGNEIRVERLTKIEKDLVSLLCNNLWTNMPTNKYQLLLMLNHKHSPQSPEIIEARTCPPPTGLVVAMIHAPSSSVWTVSCHTLIAPYISSIWYIENVSSPPQHNGGSACMRKLNSVTTPKLQPPPRIPKNNCLVRLFRLRY
jgi:hypothetical protein